MIALRARIVRRLRRRRDDSGFTLMEVMVGAALMSVVMAIATSGFVSMFHTAEETEANALTESNLMLAFSKLDREVRYAYRVNTPYMADTDTYAVSYVGPDANSVLQCVLLTLPVSGGSLLHKQWPQDPMLAASPVVTSGVAATLTSANTTTNAGGAKVPATPFILLRSGQGNSNFDRLQINVNSTVGAGSQGATRNYDLQFTALNTQNVDIDLTCANR